MSVDVAQGGNHPGVRDHAEVSAKTAVAHVVTGRASVFSTKSAQEIRGIRPFLVKCGRRTQTSPSSWLDIRWIWKLIEDTDFDCAPPCGLGHVLRDVPLRALYLRQKHGPGALIVLSPIDIKIIVFTGSSGPTECSC